MFSFSNMGIYKLQLPRNQVRRMLRGPAKQRKRLAAVTLVEVMATVLILTIAVLGASGYRYYTALDVRKAAMHRTAAEVAQLLCESWRGLEGTETYDPIAYFGSHLAPLEVASPMIGPCKNGKLLTGLAIEAGYEGPAPSADFTLLGLYKITTDGADYYAVLSWTPLEISPPFLTSLRPLKFLTGWKDTSPGPRALNVIVACPATGACPEPLVGEPRWPQAPVAGQAYKLFKLTTYTHLGQ